VIGGGRWTNSLQWEGLHVTAYGDVNGAQTIANHARKTLGRIRVPTGTRRSVATALQWKPSGERLSTLLGTAILGKGEFRIGRHRAPITIAIVQETSPPVDVRLVLSALFPQPFWPSELRHALQAVNGLPTAWEFFADPKASTSAARMELVDVESVQLAPGWAEPPAYPQSPSYTSSGSRDFKARGRPPHDDDFDETPVRQPRVPVDAGVAFGPKFYGKLAAAAIVGATVLLPFESQPLRFDLDWFNAYRDALMNVGRDAASLDRDLAFISGTLINGLIEEADDVDDLDAVTAFMSEDEVAEFTVLLAAEDPADRRWFEFSTPDRRNAIALEYLVAVLVPPTTVNLEPAADFSDDLDDIIEGATATYDRDTDEIQFRNLFGVMHLHLTKLRFTLRPGAPAAELEGITSEGAQLRLRLEFCQLTFDFWTEPSAEIWMIIIRILTIGLTDAALWNDGVGDISLGPSALVGTLAPERVEDRLRTRWRSSGELSQVDTNVFVIGWNPLQDLVTLTGSLILSLFDVLSGTALARVERSLNDRLDDERVLEFPRSFTCGSDIVDDGPDADPATRVLAAPQSVNGVITAGESIYYRGMYGRQPRGTAETAPFNPHMPRDGAYVVHRQVFDRMVERRSGLQNNRLTPTIPEPAGRRNSDLFPAFVRDIRRVDVATLRQLTDAGLLPNAERRQWVSGLEYLHIFAGMSEGPIFDEFEDLAIPVLGAIGVPRVYLAVAARVTLLDGLDGIPFGGRVGDVALTVTARHVMDLDFVYTDERPLRDVLANLLRALEGVTLPILPGTSTGVVLTPFRFGSVPILDAPIGRRMVLRLGLWNQGLLTPLPGLPAALQFSLTDPVPLAPGAVTFRTDVPEFREQARIDLVREAAGTRTDNVLARLERNLQDIAHYLAFYELLEDLPAGADWSVVRNDRVTGEPMLTVRTEGDRLYLDFEVDPLFLGDLALWDLWGSVM
jgi:hypothetical protein